MRSRPRVTISIPTYNHERYIGRAIGSALAQDYANLEIVVCDDVSTDATFRIAQQFEGAGVRVYRNKHNIGRVANYRHCLYELATGEWAVNLDGDDHYIEPTFVSRAIDLLMLEPQAVLYAAGSSCLHESDRRIEQTLMEFEGDRLVMAGTDYVLGYPALGASQHFSIVYNRRLALESDFYSLDSLGTDTDSIFRLALKGKVIVEKKWVGAWTHHERNASYSLTEEALEKELAMLRRIAASLAEHVPPAEVHRWLDRQIREKKRFVLVLLLSKLPLREAWPLWLKRAHPDLTTAKEAAKLLLRTTGLR